VRVLHAHLKTDEGQAALHAELARTDVLITSFRPSALAKLGLGWEALQVRYPRLSLVRIVGALGERAEEPGHDLTYQAEAGLLAGLQAPPPCSPTWRAHWWPARLCCRPCWRAASKVLCASKWAWPRPHSGWPCRCTGA
jgi:crotonobetainyl-CoA:carnitine CoA-transferase CaiB-like acyl-CoA transferase